MIEDLFYSVFITMKGDIIGIKKILHVSIRNNKIILVNVCK